MGHKLIQSNIPGPTVDARCKFVAQEALRATKVRPSLVEGYRRAEWILIDFFDFVVHVFTPDTRRFYALERLWGNAERIEIAEPKEPSASTGRST